MVHIQRWIHPADWQATGGWYI